MCNGTSLVPDGAKNFPLKLFSFVSLVLKLPYLQVNLSAHHVCRPWQIQLEYHAPKLNHRVLCRSADVPGFCPSMISLWP